MSAFPGYRRTQVPLKPVLNDGPPKFGKGFKEVGKGEPIPEHLQNKLIRLTPFLNIGFQDLGKVLRRWAMRVENI